MTPEIAEQIAALEAERDATLASTAYEVLSTKQHANGRVTVVTTHSKIRSKYNTMIGCLKKYGVTTVRKLKSAREKELQTKLERHGKTCFIDYAKSVQTKHKRYGNGMGDLAKMRATCQQRYACDYPCQTEQCRTASPTISGWNKWMHAWLLEVTGIDFEYEFKIDTQSYDLRYGNLLIELNPSYSHNSTYGFRYLRGYSDINEPKPVDYHANKTLLAHKHGYRVINIWDWDDKDKIVSHIANILKQAKPKYARKLQLVQISAQEANQFLLQYHFQGRVNGQTVCLALKDADYIVQVMTFGKARYNKNYEWELLRLCSSCKVVGGSQKLFKYFVDTYKPTSIVSYCDISKFTGDVYAKLGFANISCKIGKHWYNWDTGQHFTDSLLRQRGADALIGTNEGKGTSNADIMLAHNFVEVYDAGQTTYAWHAK